MRVCREGGCAQHSYCVGDVPQCPVRLQVQRLLRVHWAGGYTMRVRKGGGACPHGSDIVCAGDVPLRRV